MTMEINSEAEILVPAPILSHSPSLSALIQNPELKITIGVRRKERLSTKISHFSARIA